MASLRLDTTFLPDKSNRSAVDGVGVGGTSAGLLRSDEDEDEDEDEDAKMGGVESISLCG